MDELREAFDKAWDESEEENTPAEEEQQAAPPEEGGEDVVASNEEVNIGDDTPEPETPEKTAEQAQETPPSKKAEIETPAKGEKAPASWSPGNRESWSKLPPNVKQQVMKREREVNVALQGSAEARKMVGRLNETLMPYRDGLINAGINDPMQAVGQALYHESILRTGSLDQKAQMIANLIKNYNVDIAALDGMLAGQGAQPSNPNAQLEAMIDQRMGPVNQFLQMQQQQYQQAAYQEQAQASQAVDEFSQSAEFINDVRNDMADMMDAAAARGQQMTLQEAYTKACAIHPEISQILAQRQQQQQIMGTNNATAQKKAAASSITGGRAGGGEGGGDLSLRDQIAEAWNSQTG